MRSQTKISLYCQLTVLFMFELDGFIHVQDIGEKSKNELYLILNFV